MTSLKRKPLHDKAIDYENELKRARKTMLETTLAPPTRTHQPNSTEPLLLNLIMSGIPSGLSSGHVVITNKTRKVTTLFRSIP